MILIGIELNIIFLIIKYHIALSVLIKKSNKIGTPQRPGRVTLSIK